MNEEANEDHSCQTIALTLGELQTHGKSREGERGEGGRENFSHGKKYLPLSSEDESPGQSVDVFDLLC